MAGKQSSEVKRRTASTRKTTTTRKSSAGKKRNTSGKSANQRHRACKSVNIQNLWEMRSN